MGGQRPRDPPLNITYTVPLLQLLLISFQALEGVPTVETAATPRCSGIQPSSSVLLLLPVRT